nr:MAG TPA: hypothetical protein [Caudoviricetes sp.]
MHHGFEFKIIEKNDKEVKFLKNAVEKLQELNKELKEENDKWEVKNEY